MKKIELLAPAKDVETAQAAINCGADAVYIGASRFGAREAAGNPLVEIEQLVSYAHRYWAKVYITLNTLLYDAEIPEAVSLSHQLYQLGVDGLIIQDVGLLECDLPPLPLIASTQMHNHLPEKVAFLEKVGFQRVILARELSLEQIREIRSQTTIELETFIHGALCVSYSGQCYLSFAIGGRSGNRGQCAQPCRRRYTLIDNEQNLIVKDRYLLSLRDLNLTAYLGELLQAGISSFKIEGRLKDKSYVMNVVAHYRRALDALLNEFSLQKSSSGQSILDFDPDPTKTFNRGFTTYFLLGRGAPVASPDTPKQIGEPVGKVTNVERISFTLDSVHDLHNGDGISFFDAKQELQGTIVNHVLNHTIVPARMDGIEKGMQIFRNHDHEFINRLLKSRSERKIAINLRLVESREGFELIVQDEDGVSASAILTCEKIPAEKPEKARENITRQLTKLGETEFLCSQLVLELSRPYFFPLSLLNDLRRRVVENLRQARSKQRPVLAGGVLKNSAPYPEKQLSFSGNVLNKKAEAFYRRHGVESIEPAAESGLDLLGSRVMTTKLCLKYQLGYCPRLEQHEKASEPLFLVDEDGRKLRLRFDCGECKMEVYYS